ncbi:phage tail protein I [Sapientia aquatica]|uniref:Phage tail protein I n=1 Tax=Sapientia aquatica TaxID=1549640 RepID=A0A4R5W2H2_9BURK|nr:phage tail protein I [Sapientia aquatica]TDK65967.1 phage tail protein I [Sapientia aquatica]
MTSAPLVDALLPPPLASDPRCIALAQIAARISNVDLLPLLVYMIDTVPTSALAQLADQFHLLGEGWQFAQNEAEQRAILKRGMELHRHKGTRWAILQVLETLALEGNISEWFDYGGKPYHFKMNITVPDRGIDAQTFDNLVLLINEYKNVRSVLQELRITLSVSSQIPIVGLCTMVGEIAAVYPRD